ncbi:MAG: FAD/NAD(P)-binding protein [Thermodesulfobacteriota bacterium]
MNNNVYLPQIAVIKDIKEETGDIKTFTLAFKDRKFKNSFSFRPGQFMMVSVFQAGEVPISISSSPSQPENLQLSIKKAGALTGKIHGHKVGDEIGLRGPYGRSFPVERLIGKNLLFVAGGIGLAPLRSLINYVLNNRTEFGQITILHGARTPSDIPFKHELSRWPKERDVKVLVTVDRPDTGWKGNIGPATALWDKTGISSRDTIAVICGPPVMISFVVMDLLKMGFSEDDIISTLERHMKCGVGKCGHCSIGHQLTCVDGPVFTYREMKELPTDL